MYEENFSRRLVQLRMAKGVSARDMSLSIGQNPGYINNIENGKALPSMTAFFYICEYLDITPAEFFNFDFPYPQETAALIQDLSRLTHSQFNCIREIVKDLGRQGVPQK